MSNFEYDDYKDCDGGARMLGCILLLLMVFVTLAAAGFGIYIFISR